MKMSRLSNRHWRLKLSEAVGAFVVLTRKAGDTLDGIREAVSTVHCAVESADFPLLANLIAESCHSIDRIADILEHAFQAHATPIGQRPTDQGQTTQPDRTCLRCSIPATFVDSAGVYLCRQHAEDSSRTVSHL